MSKSLGFRISTFMLAWCMRCLGGMGRRLGSGIIYEGEVRVFCFDGREDSIVLEHKRRVE